MTKKTSLRDPAYIGRDQIRCEERMRAVEPYPAYYDRRVDRAWLIGGLVATTLTLAEYFGLDTNFVKSIVENTGNGIVPLGIGAVSGAIHYATRK